MLAQTEGDVDMQLPGFADTVRSQQWVAPANKVKDRVSVRVCLDKGCNPLRFFGGNPISPHAGKGLVDSGEGGERGREGDGADG